MVDNFNVANPTKENIEYAIKNLLFYVNASASLEIYAKYKKLFTSLIFKINNVLSAYFNSNCLRIIDENDLIEIKEELMQLDWETKLMDSYYAEWAFVWIDAIITLRQSEINLGGVVICKDD